MDRAGAGGSGAGAAGVSSCSRPPNEPNGAAGIGAGAGVSSCSRPPNEPNAAVCVGGAGGPNSSGGFGPITGIPVAAIAAVANGPGVDGTGAGVGGTGAGGAGVGAGVSGVPSGFLRARVFSGSVCDWLDNKAPQQWRIDLAAVIAATPDLDWMLLSKRIENYRKLTPWPWAEPPPNVWIGATTENQEYFGRRWRILRDIPARVTFVSYEPAMGPLHLPMGVLPDWLICGGQDGAGAKSFVMEPQWARDIRDDCLAGGTAFFMKQMTNKTEIPDDLLIRQFPA